MPAVARWIASHLNERLMDLPEPVTRDVRVHRDLRVPMGDGVELLADHYVPATAGSAPPPVILVRSPYGRRGPFGLLYGRPLAERGFQVLVQSVRGTFGSGGRFQPFGDERDDGLATIRWIREQPWFSGQLAMTGISYLGYVQWAVADAGLDALCIQASTSDFSEHTYDGSSFALATSLTWTQLVIHQESWLGARTMAAARKLRGALNHLPLASSDQLIAGQSVGWYQDWVTGRPDDEYWSSRSHTGQVARLQAPVAMRSGWYDIFLPWQLRDYDVLVAEGHQPRLIIGPWAHSSIGMLRGIGRDTVEFLRERLLGEAAPDGGPVRYFLTGGDQWRDADSWPPPGVHDQEWALMPGGELRPDGSDGADAGGIGRAGGASVFRYDPANPTPAVGGPTLDGRTPVVNNRTLESRTDVLVFSSRPLTAPVEIAGTPVARISVSADNPFHDLFVRLCDVSPDGVSVNVCDRLLRLGPRDSDLPEGFRIDETVDGVRLATISLWPAAHRFLAGHRVRVQISAGAHPRYPRNLGTGEPLATAIRMVPSFVSVHHNHGHPSAITLPVLPAEG